MYFTTIVFLPCMNSGNPWGSELDSLTLIFLSPDNFIHILGCSSLSWFSSPPLLPKLVFSHTPPPPNCGMNLKEILFLESDFFPQPHGKGWVWVVNICMPILKHFGMRLDTTSCSSLTHNLQSNLGWVGIILPLQFLKTGSWIIYQQKKQRVIEEDTHINHKSGKGSKWGGERIFGYFECPGSCPTLALYQRRHTEANGATLI